MALVLRTAFAAPSVKMARCEPIEITMPMSFANNDVANHVVASWSVSRSRLGSKNCA